MKQFRTSAAALCLALLAMTPAHAMSGAELIQMTQRDGEMYTWGLVQGLIGYFTQETIELSYARQQCLIRAGIRSNTFFATLTDEIRRDPVNLSALDTQLVVKLVARICGQ